MIQPNSYRKRPITIKAIQLTPQNIEEVFKWVQGTGGVSTDNHRDHITIHTLEGGMRAELGDWIIQGIQGEFYPCKPDIFVATYEVDK